MATRGSSKWRYAAWGKPGTASKGGDQRLATITVQPSTGTRSTVNAAAQEAFRALGQVLDAYDYRLEQHHTGAYNYRTIRGGRAMSSHSWGTAIDLNWQDNPYTKDPKRGQLMESKWRPMIDAIMDVKTKNGQRVFRWGGDWDNRPDTSHSIYDSMHFEVIASKYEMEKYGIDWNTVPGAPKAAYEPAAKPMARGWADAMVRSLPFLSKARTPARNDFTKRVQALLNSEGFRLTVDGGFGSKTEDAVQRFQARAGLSADGVVGPNTWSALLDVEGERLPTLSTRSRDKARVKKVQRLVNVQRRSNQQLKADGAFGPNTEKAVKAFQKKVGLAPDGFVGPNTWKALMGV